MIQECQLWKKIDDESVGLWELNHQLLCHVNCIISEIMQLIVNKIYETLE